MRTKRWIGLFGILSLMLATLASVGQPRQATAAVPCITRAFDITGGSSGAQISVHDVPSGDEECNLFQIPEGQILIAGGDKNDLYSGGTELHANHPHSIKALAWDPKLIIQSNMTWGQLRLVPAERAQCEFEKWLHDEPYFTENFPLPEWAGKTAVCGPLDGGGSDATFKVEAPKVVSPDTKVTITVTSDPTGQPATMAIGNDTPVTLSTPFTATFASPAGQGAKIPWVLTAKGNQVDTGEIDVLPTQDKWNEGGVPFSFSTDEDTTKQNVLRICGDLPSGYVLLVSGEVVASEAYGVLTTLAGHVDTYVRNAFVEGVAGCNARPEFDRLKAAGGSNLSIFHAPAACSVRQYVPIVKR